MPPHENQPALNRAAHLVPPYTWFGLSAVFHYLGPAFAVLLFPVTGVLGIAWFRITSAALIFAPFTRPWRSLRQADRATRALLLGLGLCLAVMNCSFYLALERLPMALVAAMEFVGTLVVALYGLRTIRNLAALALAVTGVVLLINVTWVSDPAGLFWAGLNAVLFSLYIILGHKAAASGADGGVERLGAAMAIAAAFMLPVGLMQVSDTFGSPMIILAGVGVGISSSVIPYICDQMAMSRLPRASFALALSLLPAMAVIIAALLLAQIPSLRDITGIALVMSGIALHRSEPC